MVNVLVGLVGLGLVVFVHELGHLVAARASGITVEAFSIGWGRKLWSFTRGGTEYRVGWLPLGGYCKMQGEHALARAWQERSSRIDVEPGDFYGAAPWKRIVVLAAGPVVNYIFAALVLGAIAMAGYTTYSFPSRIVLVSQFATDQTGAADLAGLQSGDVVTAIDQRPVESFRDLQLAVSRAPRQELQFSVQRGDTAITTVVTPELDVSSGAGRIGVFPWIDPVVGSVAPQSPADIAGLQPGDRIISLEGEEVLHTVSLDHRVRGSRGNAPMALVVERDGTRENLTLIPDRRDDGTPVVGIAWQAQVGRSPSFGLFTGFMEGFRQAGETLILTVRGIGLLFSGIDLNQALMGPARITYLVGEVATEGFRAGVGSGLLSFFNFLSLISVTLFFMNLLPIPALDGGQILLTVYEILSRKPLHPRLVYRFQIVGTVMILALLAFAVFNDILFFARS